MSHLPLALKEPLPKANQLSMVAGPVDSMPVKDTFNCQDFLNRDRPKRGSECAFAGVGSGMEHQIEKLYGGNQPIRVFLGKTPMTPDAAQVS
jgi:hypothetical protein